MQLADAEKDLASWLSEQGIYDAAAMKEYILQYAGCHNEELPPFYPVDIQYASFDEPKDSPILPDEQKEKLGTHRLDREKGKRLQNALERAIQKLQRRTML